MLPFSELQRSNQGGPNKQTSLNPLFIDVGISPEKLNLSPYPDWRTQSSQHTSVTPVIRLLHPPEHQLHSLAAHERTIRKVTIREGESSTLQLDILCQSCQWDLDWWCAQVKLLYLDTRILILLKWLAPFLASFGIGQSRYMWFCWSVSEGKRIWNLECLPNEEL